MSNTYEPLYASDHELPQSVKNFEEAYLKKHGNKSRCVHNIYHLIAEDIDGNVVDEAFGLNVLTDNGFYYMYKGDSSLYGSYFRMWVGDGVFTTIDPSSSSMVSSLSNTPANVTNDSWTYMHTEWVPDMESNEVLWRICSGWYDYTQWDEDKTITEIGVGCRDRHNTPTDLKYHAAVYDSEGNKSSFVKRVNQKLTISVYIKAYFPIVKVINSMWDAGYPCALRTDAMFQQSYASYWNYNSACYFPYDWRNKWVSGDWIKWYTRGSIVDHVYSTEKTLGMDQLIDGRNQYISDIVVGNKDTGDNSNLYGQYWIVLGKFRAPNPIPFSTDHYRTMMYNDGSLRFTYARRLRDTACDQEGRLPMTNIHISSLTMYNDQTDDWDINVPYTEPVQYIDGGYSHLRASISERNWISFLNDYRSFRVFINEAPQYPIKCIYNCGRTMYTTDEYWDSTSWDIIPDTSNISRAQGSKRYFIMFDDAFDRTYSDYWVRYYGEDQYTRRISRYDYDDKFPILNLNNGSFEDSVDFGVRNIGYYSQIYRDAQYSGKAICNETLGYIAQDGFIVFPESVDPNPNKQYYSTPSATGNLTDIPYYYNIGGVDLADGVVTGTGNDGSYPGLIWNTTRGTHIVACGYNSQYHGCRVYTITNDPSIPPGYVNFIYDEDFTARPASSHSDNGYFVQSYLAGTGNVNCTYVVEYDVNGVLPNMYKLEGYHSAFAIDLTDYFVAIDATVTDHLHMVIYDMANRTIHDSFDLPAGYTFAGIAGWNNFIYVRVNNAGAIMTYIYYINEHTLEITSLDIPTMIWDTSSWYSHIQLSVPENGNVESCMVLMASDRDPSAQYHMLFKSSDPTNPIELIRRSNNETSSGIKWKKASLRYTSDNKQLLLSYNGHRMITLDVGWILKYGTENTHYTWADLYDESSNQYCPIYYKGYIYGMQLYGYKAFSNVISSYCRYFRWPYQLHMNLSISGTTYTPNSMMNPVRIQGNISRTYFSATNRDVNTPPTPYTPPL